MSWIRVPVGEWLADTNTDVLPALETGGLSIIINGIPSEYGYRNCKRPVETGTAADQKLTGAGNGVQTDGTYQMFAGGATKLFRYSAGWVNASRVSGGAYTGTTANWSFGQFGPLQIATNGVDAPQKFTIGGTGNFSALGGTPPIAKYVIIVRDFVVFLNVSGATNRVHWSAINNAEDYVASATTQSDTQDIPDEGAIIGGIGGEYGLIFFANAVYRMTYIGAPLIFQFDKIGDIGLAFPMSPARQGENVFYVSREGFAVVQSGQACQNVGAGKVNRDLLAEASAALSNPTRAFGAIDPENSLYLFAVPSSGETNCNRIYALHWPSGRWGHYILGNSESPSTKLELIFQTTVGGILTIAGVGAAHKFATLDGSSDTMELYSHIFEPIPGRRFFIRGISPLVSQVTHTEIRAKAITYPRQPLESEAATTTSPFAGGTVVGSNGVATLRASGRCLRLYSSINMGGAAISQDWVFQGWEIDIVPEGER